MTDLDDIIERGWYKIWPKLKKDLESAELHKKINLNPYHVYDMFMLPPRRNADE